MKSLFSNVSKLAVVLSIMFSFSYAVYSQDKDSTGIGLGIAFGYSNENHLLMDLAFVHSSGIGLKLGLGLELAIGTEGEDYTNTINWDQYPKDLVKEGSYLTTFDFSFGYFHKYFFVLGLIGYANETEYRNCFDDFHILGDNGKYYKTRNGDSGLNFGGEIGLRLLNGITISCLYSEYNGIGGKIGIIQYLPMKY